MYYVMCSGRQLYPSNTCNQKEHVSFGIQQRVLIFPPSLHACMTFCYFSLTWGFLSHNAMRLLGSGSTVSDLEGLVITAVSRDKRAGLACQFGNGLSTSHYVSTLSYHLSAHSSKHVQLSPHPSSPNHPYQTSQTLASPRACAFPPHYPIPSTGSISSRLPQPLSLRVDHE